MPTPRPDEDKSSFISRCIPFVSKENPNRPNEQNVAVCYSIWERHIKKAEEKEEPSTRPPQSDEIMRDQEMESFIKKVKEV